MTETPFANYQIQKITGHSNNLGNDLADALATNNSTKIAKIIKENDVLFGKMENLENF